MRYQQIERVASFPPPNFINQRVTLPCLDIWGFSRRVAKLPQRPKCKLKDLGSRVRNVFPLTGEIDYPLVLRDAIPRPRLRV